MTLLAAVVLALGVSVAVQVMPPSLLSKSDSTPLAALKSAKASPVTASLKVMVTAVLWPIPNTVSATTMVAVGRSVSIA